jgi:hypothetical protein
LAAGRFGASVASRVRRFGAINKLRARQARREQPGTVRKTEPLH